MRSRRRGQMQRSIPAHALAGRRKGLYKTVSRMPTLLIVDDETVLVRNLGKLFAPGR